MIAPVSSAIGMNSPGETTPKSGLVQRSRASTATISPLATATTG